VKRRDLARYVAVLIVLWLVLAASLNTAIAQNATPPAEVAPDTLAFVIYPAEKQQGDFFTATIKAGEQTVLKAVLGNTGKVAFKARTYALNAGTAPNGGFLAASKDAPPNDVTRWLDYPEATYDLEPGKAVQLPLTIKVPKGTAPGQYLTAVAMETAEPRAVGGSAVFKQVIQQVVPVFITVPGPIKPKFEIGDITLTTQGVVSALTIEIKNRGNVRVKPTGTVTVTDASGATVLTAPITMDSVYARDETMLTIGVPALAGGTYKVSAEFKDPETGAKASVSDVKVAAQASATPVAVSPVAITSATATPQPSLDKIQFLNIAVTITNNGDAITNARLTLSVSHDGKAIEDYPLSESLALPIGDTTVQSRYIPATGWSSGTWTFSLRLESVDPNTGVAATIAARDLGGPIVVP
jgi:hypothetical protein